MCGVFPHHNEKHNENPTQQGAEVDLLLLLRNPSAVPVTSARASVSGPQSGNSSNSTTTTVSVAQPRISADAPLVPGGQVGVAVTVRGGAAAAAAAAMAAATSNGNGRYPPLEFRISVEYTGSLPHLSSGTEEGNGHNGQGGGPSVVYVRTVVLELRVLVVPGALITTQHTHTIQIPTTYP